MAVAAAEQSTKERILDDTQNLLGRSCSNKKTKMYKIYIYKYILEKENISLCLSKLLTSSLEIIASLHTHLHFFCSVSKEGGFFTIRLFHLAKFNHSNLLLVSESGSK